MAGVIMSWMAPGMQHFVTIGTGVSAPQIRYFAVPLGWIVSSFKTVFNGDTAYITQLNSENQRVLLLRSTLTLCRRV